MESVKEFMLLFRMTPSTQQPTQEQLKAMHQQWGAFIGQIAGEGKLVNVSRLGFESAVIAADKNVEHVLFIEGKMAVSGNLTLKAENIEEAIELAKRCPVLFAGGTVEVRPTLPMN